MRPISLGDYRDVRKQTISYFMWLYLCRKNKWKWKSLSRCLTVCDLMHCSPQNSPGQNTGVGSLSLLQGIFPTQESNQGLLHCRQILYQLSHKGSPRILERVAYPFSSRSSQPRNRTRVSCIAGRFFTNWAIMEALFLQRKIEISFSWSLGHTGLGCYASYSDFTETENGLKKSSICLTNMK